MQFLYLLEEIRTPFLDALMSAVTKLGEQTVAIAVICVLFWCVDKRIAYGIGLSYFISGLAVQSAKLACKVPRPWVIDPSFKPVESALDTATGYSFPSGHSQSSGALFGTAGMLVKKPLVRAALFAAALAVGFSRMYLGVHTPADVCAGLAVSFAAAAAVAALFRRFYDKKGFDFAALLTVGVLAAASMIYALIPGVESDARYIADSCKTAGAALGFALGFYIERRCINFDTGAPSTAAQAAKVVFGLAAAILLKSGLAIILGGGAIAGGVRYFILVMWVLALYPMIFKRVLGRRNPREEPEER